MLQRFRLTSARWTVAALYALAVVMTGLAHRPVATAAPGASELAAYALPHGSLPPICAHDDGAPAGKTHAGERCDACALSAAPGLPPVDQIALRAPVARIVALAMNEGAQFAPAPRHAPTSRGPPLS